MHDDPLRYRHDVDARGAERIAHLLGWSFGHMDRLGVARLERAGRENLRVLHDGKEPVACLFLLDLGQHFGGRRLSCAGVNAVAVAPPHRGRGLATRLMQDALLEMFEGGCALSALYPATEPLYRKLGYERAGHRMEVTVPLAQIGAGDHELDLRPAGPGDTRRIQLVQQRYAVRFNGHLRRAAFNWLRIRQPGEDEATAFVVEGPDGPEGYLFLLEKQYDRPRYDLQLSDVAALTPAAARRILGLLTDHASLADRASWCTGPGDPLLTLLPEQRFRLRVLYQWMLRIVNLRAALEGRGYPLGLTAELHLEVVDPVVEANRGRFVLTVDQGEGHVYPGGQGRVRLEIGSLASLFSGFLSPVDLAVAGRIEGPEEELVRMAAVFAGPTPWMPDMF